MIDNIYNMSKSGRVCNEKMEIYLFIYPEIVMYCLILKMIIFSSDTLSQYTLDLWEIFLVIYE